jgi:putative two-component system response regulator
MVVYLIIVDKINLYNITDTAIDSLVQNGDTGFVSVDYKLNYLCSNATAKAVLPELNELTVDRPLSRVPATKVTLLAWIEAFRKN